MTDRLLHLFQHHDELVTELAKSMTEISVMLPRTNSYLELYSSPVLEKKAETLFTLIIRHFHEMLKFYSEGRLKHAWKSFIQPYSMRFKALKDEIDQCSRSFEQYVQISLHVNVDANRKAQLILGNRVDVVDSKVDMMSSKVNVLDGKLGLLLSRMCQSKVSLQEKIVRFLR